MDEGDSGVRKKSFVRKRNRIRPNFTSSSSESDSDSNERIVGIVDKEGIKNGKKPSNLFDSDNEMGGTLQSRSHLDSLSSGESEKSKRVRIASDSSSSEDANHVTRKPRSRSNSNSSDEAVVQHQLAVPDVSDDESADEQPKLERAEEVIRKNGYLIPFRIQPKIR